ncbi:MAG: hypothetical protein ACJ8F7_16895 [Gemmataceae bacterium]
MAKSNGKLAASRGPKNGEAMGGAARRMEAANGRASLTPAASSLDDLLVRVFKEFVKRRGLTRKEYDELKFDFVFHMRDAKEDFENLVQLYKHPEGRNAETELLFIIGFLHHVIPHLRAAGRILMGEEIKGAFEKPGPIEIKANRMRDSLPTQNRGHGTRKG